MDPRKSLYHRHRFPQDIIRHAVWLYYRFCLSYRDVEELLAERGIKVSYETVRRWCIRFASNRAELSHEPTRQRERTMRRFKSMGQAQRFLTVHGTMKNMFAVPRHLLRAKNYRLF